MTPNGFLREYETAARARDLSRVLSLIDENAVFWFSDATRHVGKQAIERAIRNNFETISEEDYRISDVVTLAESAEVAACTFHFQWTGVVRGEPASGRGRGTIVLVRRGDSWTIVHEHLSKGA